MRTTVPDFWAAPLPDLVQRDFSVGVPGRRTCGDITYICTDEGWLYLASVLDLGSRRLVGYAIESHMRPELVSRALTMAIDTRGHDVAGMIFHHDRGAQFTSEAFTGVLQEAGVAISMDGMGRAIDNVLIERLWRTLKYDHVYLKPATSGNACRDGIDEFLTYYNDGRPHTSLNDETPDEVFYQARLNQRAA